MKKFIQSILLFAVPFIFGLGLYIYLDPFKVIKSYETFIDSKAPGYIWLNRDYVSTATFDNNYKSKNYNSFIFGNSRSIYYQISDWEKHLPQNSHCFHFDASDETLFALHRKIRYIDRKNLEILNALLILDFATLVLDKPKSGHLFMISPQLVGYSNIIDFHFTYLKAFITPKFLYSYIDFKISGKVKHYMKTNFLLDDKPMNYDVMTNEIRYDNFEELINQNEYYTSKRLSVFYKRDSVQSCSPVAIKENQRAILRKIHDIFKKHNTNYKIIISPLYDQLKLNPEDLKYLEDLFGAKNVFDFSGINEITKDHRNYYEDSHYRPHVARQIMTEIYTVRTHNNRVTENLE